MENEIKKLDYVMITPARNEEANIERLIKSMVQQDHLPLKWVIVNDASTDGTLKIIEKYSEAYQWIEAVNMPTERDRSFAAKVGCFNAGYEKVQGLNYEVIGCLDADLSFEKDYLKFLVEKFALYSEIGVAGTPFVEDDGYSSIDDSFEGARHVAGGCQMFRKDCFEEIGGYIPNKEGGIDWIAVTSARMMGWRTESFPEKVFHHHRTLGTGESNKIHSLFSYGRKDYYLGNHPVWEGLRLLYRCTKKPYLIGGLIMMTGYFSGLLTRMQRPISKELVRFHQDEEMRKLKAIIISKIKNKKINKFELKY